MKRAYYHHPVTPDYSLQFVKGSQQAVLKHINERGYDEVKLLCYPYEPAVFAVYVREIESRDVADTP